MFTKHPFYPWCCLAYITGHIKGVFTEAWSRGTLIPEKDKTWTDNLQASMSPPFLKNSLGNIITVVKQSQNKT